MSRPYPSRSFERCCSEFEAIRSDEQTELTMNLLPKALYHSWVLRKRRGLMHNVKVEEVRLDLGPGKGEGKCEADVTISGLA